MNEYLHAAELPVSVINLGLPDTYIEHAQREEQLAACGLDAQGIVNRVRTSKAGKSCVYSAPSLSSASLR